MNSSLYRCYSLITFFSFILSLFLRLCGPLASSLLSSHGSLCLPTFVESDNSIWFRLIKHVFEQVYFLFGILNKCPSTTNLVRYHSAKLDALRNKLWSQKPGKIFYGLRITPNPIFDLASILKFVLIHQLKAVRAYQVHLHTAIMHAFSGTESTSFFDIP